MDRTIFSAYDELVFSLYAAEDFDHLKQKLFSGLHRLIPYRFASLRIAGGGDLQGGDSASAPNIFCDPESYRKAEMKYMEQLNKDRSSSSVRFVKREGREEYTCIQLKLEWMGQFLGTLTLFRRAGSNGFTEEEKELLHSVGKYLHVAVNRHLRENSRFVSLENVMTRIEREVHLTPREKEVLTRLYRTESNPDICDHLGITEHTLQKHLQNLYRKLNICSRWELVQYLLAG